MEDIPVLREYADVFPEEISGLPVPSAVPGSKAPYRMNILKLNELKSQLKELIEKNYIRPNVSPWGAPFIFVKKKDGTM